MLRTSARRARAAVVALALTATTVGTVAATSPAQAVDASCTTKTTLTINGHRANQVVQWGDYESVHVDVSAVCVGDSSLDIPLGGSTRLYRSTDGGHTWSKIKGANGTNASFISYYGTNIIKRNTKFKATYSGGTDAYNNHYTASSAYNQARIKRKVSYTWKSVRGGVRYNYAIAPASSIRGLHVIFKKKKSTHWVTIRKVRVNRYGHVVGTFGLGKYRMSMPSARGFIASYHAFGVVRARATAGRAVAR